MRFSASIAAVTLLLAAVRPVLAEDAPLRRGVSGAEKHGASAENLSLAEKRAWLRDQMLREFSDVDRAAEIKSQVAQMSPERVDALVKIYRKRAANLEQEMTNEQRRVLAASDAYRNARVQDYQNRLADRAIPRPEVSA